MGDAVAQERLTCPDWLIALPHAAAVLVARDDRFQVESANEVFTRRFPATSVDWLGTREGGRRFSAETMWAFLDSEKAFERFELQFQGGFETEYLAGTLGRLEPSADGAPRLLATFIDRTSERKSERNLRRELVSDSLTALPNRTGFGEEIDARLAIEVDGIKTDYAILVIDLARFSRINEALGAVAGDELIITVARRLKSSLRQGDILSRLGGNEFAIFARLNTGLSDALHLVQRINETLLRPVRLSELEISVDCAIGCALSTNGETDAEDVMRQAQAAMKIAKRTGKLEIYRPGALRESYHRFNIESSLREALEKGQLTLAFQPLVNLKTDVLTGFEALARWNHPDLGPISPADFIPVAEESGLIVPLGRWAMHEAAQTLARWDRVIGETLPLSVNVNMSAIQMVRDNVPLMVEEALRYSGVAGNRMTIELTESAIVADPEKARQVLSALKNLDASLAMDDFGTGFSNLASLQKLPIDVLKIDRSFVTEMLRDADKLAIVGAVLSLCEALNLKATAEGIETRELARALSRLGCDQGQGYYFAKPMSADAALDYWLSRNVRDTEATAI